MGVILRDNSSRFDENCNNEFICLSVSTLVVLVEYNVKVSVKFSYNWWSPDNETTFVLMKLTIDGEKVRYFLVRIQKMYSQRYEF